MRRSLPRLSSRGIRCSLKDLYSAGVESTSDMRIDSFQIGKSSGALVRRFGFIFWCVALGGQNVKNLSVFGGRQNTFFPAPAGVYQFSDFRHHVPKANPLDKTQYIMAPVKPGGCRILNYIKGGDRHHTPQDAPVWGGCLRRFRVSAFKLHPRCQKIIDGSPLPRCVFFLKSLAPYGRAEVS